jgi:hypothetical protein
MHECAKAGIGVSRPLDDERYDLILDLRPRLLRVQCKWASSSGDGLAVRLYSSRRIREGLIRRTYSRHEIDAFVAYSAETDRCYLLDGAEVAGRTQVFLRLGTTKNNQALGIRWASDHELAATIGRLGAVAQLGERLAGSQ